MRDRPLVDPYLAWRSRLLNPGRFPALAIPGGSTSVFVNCGSGASLDQLSTDSFLTLFYPTTIGTTRILWGKRTTTGPAGGNGRHIVMTNTNRMQWAQGGMVTGWNYNTADNYITLTEWQFIAGSFDVGAAAGSVVHFYRGTLVTPISEASSYVTQTDGTGGMADDSAVDLHIGNSIEGVGSFSAAGLTPLFLRWNLVVTLTELKQQQEAIIKTGSPLATPGLVINMPLGVNGLGPQRDYSGFENHGIVNGAITLAPGWPVPMSPAWHRRSVRAGAATFQSAWALGSNVVLQPGVN